MPTNLRHLFVVSLALFAGCLAGCESDEAVRVYQAPKEPPPPPQVKPIDWKLPASWAAMPSDGMGQFGRYATIAVDPNDPSFTVGVFRLDTPGSGDLLPNLNRWEGQMGLPTSSAADAGKVSKTIQVEAHDAHRVDLTGTDAKTNTPTRMLAVVIPEGQGAWSVTLKGPPDKVAAQEANFDAFVATVHFPTHNHGDASHDHDEAQGEHDGHDHGPEASSSASAATQPVDMQVYKLAKYELPAGWVAEASERQFRVATFFTGAPGDNNRAELIVSKLPGDRFGDMVQNINRWRGEVSLAPITDLATQAFKKHSIGGRDAVSFNFDAADLNTGGAKSSTVAMVPLGRDAWFFKLIGPAKTVADQRANFDAFLKSLQFGEAGE